jgi:hypothetical protein
MSIRPLVVLCTCLWPSVAWAADVDCSTSQAVQSAIDGASSGDTLTCTAGGTWDATVTIPGTKGITLDGNGVSVTRGSLGDYTAMLDIGTNATTSTRVTGFHFVTTEATTGFFLAVGGGFGNAKFRLDHTELEANDMGTSVEVANAWGVIDHCNFSANDNAEQIHNQAWGAVDDTGWSEDVVGGSIDALYVEDNTFANSHLYDSSGTIYFWGNSAVQSYYGARTVFRYNSLTMSQIDQHGTAGMIGARWWEIYDNTFNVVPTGNQSSYVVLRAGSGVVFDNHQTGTNLGGGSIQLYEEDTGYPALYQIGRGKDQVLDPAYLWGNDAAMPVGSTSSNVLQDRDYYLAAKPGYTPLVHPHPMVGGEGGGAGSGGEAGAGTGGHGPGGSGGTGGVGTGGVAGAQAQGQAPDDGSGCGCRLPGPQRSRAPLGLALALALAVGRRRRLRG